MIDWVIMGRCVPALLGVAAVAAIFLAAGCGPVAQKPSIEQKIYATRDWQSTGLQVQPGDSIDIRAQGTWLYTPGEYHGPEGHARYPAPSSYPFPGAPGGVLLARFGNGDADHPIVIGRNITMVQVNWDGELAFRINDDYLADNDGFVLVSVSIYKGIGPK